MPAITGRASEARTRLLRTASEIFYAQGIHAVGVDHILDTAAVTRSTFYRHFPGKEDLVLAYIQATDTAVRSAVDDAGDVGAAGAAGETAPQELLRALTGLMSTQICRPGFRGCAFINAAAEYPDPASPVHQAVLEHRSWLARTAAGALRQAGHPDPEAAARHFMMLRDGAMVAGYLNDPDQARQTLEQGVDALLLAAGHRHPG